MKVYVNARCHCDRPGCEFQNMTATMVAHNCPSTRRVSPSITSAPMNKILDLVKSYQDKRDRATEAVKQNKMRAKAYGGSSGQFHTDMSVIDSVRSWKQSSIELSEALCDALKRSGRL